MQKSPILIPIRGTRDRWPRDQAGDPAFKDLADLHTLFSDVQIVAMANRYLRQQEYQSEQSLEYEARKKEARKQTKERS